MIIVARRSFALGLVAASLVLVAPDAPRTASPPVSGLVVGPFAACAVLSAAVKCWGANDSQFERSFREAITTPITAADLPRRSGALVFGNNFLCVLTPAGGVKCRGDNSFDQLGNNGGLDFRFVDVLDLQSGVKMVAAGRYAACALSRAGELKCWGLNDDGQLGNGTFGRPRLRPVSVALGGPAKAVALGGVAHACAILSSGGLKCWGAGEAGELGNGKRKNSSKPVAVSGLRKGVKAVSGGGSHTCALTSRGGVECWGSNKFGQLGNGTHRNSSTPVPVSGLGRAVKMIATGISHSCALTSAGAVKCWGSNADGALGDGTERDASTPVAVRGLAAGVEAIGAGYFHSCAMTGTRVTCWGFNRYGQLGNGTRTDSRIPVSVLLRG